MSPQAVASELLLIPLLLAVGGTCYIQMLVFVSSNLCYTLQKNSSFILYCYLLVYGSLFLLLRIHLGD